MTRRGSISDSVLRNCSSILSWRYHKYPRNVSNATTSTSGGFEHNKIFFLRSHWGHWSWENSATLFRIYVKEKEKETINSGSWKTQIRYSLKKKPEISSVTGINHINPTNLPHIKRENPKSKHSYQNDQYKTQ